MEEYNYSEAIKAVSTNSLSYLTEGLTNQEDGRIAFEKILEHLGQPVEGYPDWHPILTIPQRPYQVSSSLRSISAYEGIDHTVSFVKGFVTCPYNEGSANKLVARVNELDGLLAYRLDVSLYSNHAYPVVVEATDIELNDDGTVFGRDALIWCTQELVKDAQSSQVAETWDSLRGNLLGRPNISCSSLFVGENTGRGMKNILEAMNGSGMFGGM
ncbi:hypothetical protein QTV49_003897 [Vibrio vulnificus]|nr:hypothetical protein [Vibrio vulnificus]